MNAPARILTTSDAVGDEDETVDPPESAVRSATIGDESIAPRPMHRTSALKTQLREKLKESRR